VPDLIMNLINRVMSNLSRMAAIVVTWESKNSTLNSHNRGHIQSVQILLRKSIFMEQWFY